MQKLGLTNPSHETHAVAQPHPKGQGLPCGVTVAIAAVAWHSGWAFG